PQWFGACGDGKSDDSEALQRAADMASGAMGKTMFIPEGRYLFRRVIAVKCHIECRGTLIRKIVFDPASPQKSSSTFVDSFYPAETASIQINNDQPAIRLDESRFYGIKAGSFKVPACTGIPLKDNPSKTVDLSEGGTLIFSTTDFFTSRNNNKGDEYYTRNDICKLVSPRGDVFPEFCFSYEKPCAAAPWDAGKTYRKGEYCNIGGQFYQAVFPSGPGTVYSSPYLGKIEIGPWSPAQGNKYPFQYANSIKDTIELWVKVDYAVRYVSPQPPLTINGLQIEVYSDTADGTFRRLECGSSLGCSRSNVTFNRLRVSCKDRFSLLSSMVSVFCCTGVVFNEAHISGATHHGLGYNILHSNVASIVYNNTVSVNCRDAIAGRHGKNILINGGHYTRVDDHYGKNYTVRNAVFNAVSTDIPGYRTPKADVSKWSFIPTVALNFGGGEITVENCRFYNCGGVLSGRSDIGDFSGTIFLKNLTIASTNDVTLFHFGYNKNFDYAHQIRVPEHIIIEDVKMISPYRLNLQSLSPAPSRITVKDCERLGDINLARTEITFSGCEFADSVFTLGTGGIVNLRDCIFSGQIKGLTSSGIGYARDNLCRKGTTPGLPLNYVNPVVFEDK
ncbi:MAG: glycosyl hydrolase family 28-related protein, partial [Victivallaceae bacterium]